MKVLWITDPWITLDHKNDTTIRLIQEANNRDIISHWCDCNTIKWEEGQLYLETYLMENIEISKNFDYRKTDNASLGYFDKIMYRTDPPVNLSYLIPLQFLAFEFERLKYLNKSKLIEIINPMDILFKSNEKMEQCLYGELMPKSIVSGNWNFLYQFGVKEQITVLKPVNQLQSRGVHILKWIKKKDIEHSREILNSATKSFTSPVVLQRFLNIKKNGELRFWFIDGKCLCAARKVSIRNKLIIDMDKGDKLEKVTLSQEQKNIAKFIGKILIRRKIRVAAIDMIENLITDFNFTSPGLLTEMEKLYSINYSRMIIESLF